MGTCMRLYCVCLCRFALKLRLGAPVRLCVILYGSGLKHGFTREIEAACSQQEAVS